jgi:hypothetical protein
MVPHQGGRAPPVPSAPRPASPRVPPRAAGRPGPPPGLSVRRAGPFGAVPAGGRTTDHRAGPARPPPPAPPRRRRPGWPPVLPASVALLGWVGVVVDGWPSPAP